MDSDLKAEINNEFQQIDSLLNVLFTLNIEQPLPNTRGWAASPDVLKLLIQKFDELRPQNIIEAGSGISTVVFALLFKKYGINGKVYSLDHDEFFASKTMEHLKRHGVEEHVHILTGPLKDYSLDGENYRWYDISALDKTDVKFDLGFVDGPPTTLGKQARYPFYPLLKDKMNSSHTIIMDDAIRVDEKEIVKAWENSFDQSEYLYLEKGAQVLTKK